MARGEGKSARQGEKYLAKDQNVASNFIQYNLQKYFGDIIIGDASLHGLWRDSAKFDAIIADRKFYLGEDVKMTWMFQLLTGFVKRVPKLGTKFEKNIGHFPQLLSMHPPLCLIY